ncbi:MAG: DUF1799 domain-containing protein [Betaproteobacteria bacterium]|nr:DUF1799 domain-containing protein [Betaproteobacteria bacterium]
MSAAAAAWYAQPPRFDAAEAEAAGLTAADFASEDEVFELWPENAEPFGVFIALQTQWRAGAQGVVGLDYSAIEPVLRLQQIDTARWPALFDDLRVMERAALKVINK